MIYKTQQSAFSAGNNYIESPIFYPESAREIEPETRVVAIFDVPVDTLNQKITDIKTFVEIEVDGVVAPSDVLYYLFGSAGLHTVKYTLPNDDTIPNSAFYGCSSLISVTIPDNVTTMGSGVFSGCSSLASATIGNGVTSIGNYVFQTCSSLTSITIPDNVTSIGKSAFFGCSSLTSVVIGNGVTSIDEGAFNQCSALTSITIPNSVTSIPNSAFSDCTSLTNVIIGDSVTAIGSYAFQGCTNIIRINSDTDYVVNIPKGVITIGNNVFYGCTGFTSVVIPDSVTSISHNAFRNCSNLTSITSLATTAPTIQSSTFRDVKTGGTLYVPTGSTGYDVWIGTDNYYLGLKSWTKVEQ